MLRQCMFVGILLLGSLTGVNGKEAEAANEDVPKGPGFNALQGKTTAPQSGDQKPGASTGSVDGGDKKGAAGGGGVTGSSGGGKGSGSHK
jgi:hypothetical protein